MRKIVSNVMVVATLIALSVAENCTQNPRVLCAKSFCVKGCIDKSANGEDIYSYKSIPYAKPPVGKLRFMPPVPIEKYTSIIDGTAEMPFCTQFNIMGNGGVIGTEDCLCQSVFTRKLPPENGACDTLLPVMVWIHGGGFTAGGGSPAVYSPRFLLNGDNQNVVMVSINYRLGPLGFLSTGDQVILGNMGLKDQSLALKWVQQNIRFFCGDPDRVTIIGESAGASSVHYHMLSPMSKGLFHQAVLQSGSALNNWAYVTPSEARKRAKEAALLMGCPNDSSEAIRDCMQMADAKDLAELFERTSTWDIFHIVPFPPTKEPEGRDRFMTKSPKESMDDEEMADVPVLTGICEFEGEFLASGIWRRKSYWEIDENYLRIFPILLNYDYCAGSSHDVDKISRKIRKFYFKNRSIDNDTLVDFVNMMSDNVIISGVYENVQDFMSCMPNHNVYFYEYTFRGPVNFAQLPGYMTGGPDYKPHGTSHVDDLFPLFGIPPSDSYMQKGTPLRMMSDMMTAWWTNFIALGNPTPGESEVRWSPVEEDSFNVFNINLPSRMQTKFIYRRMKFWEKINCRMTACFL